MNQVDVDRIAALNDQHRRALARCRLSPELVNLPPEQLAAVLAAVARFDDFDQDDPQGTHESGTVEIGGAAFTWRIHYYDQTQQALAPDPSDAAGTVRVLTISRASARAPRE